jgi:hypothetical protein
MNTSTAVVPIADLERYAVTFADSGMFGTKTKAQALSLLLLAQAEGVHPAIAMRDFDIIQGRPAKKAEAMHRSFIAAGGTIEWHRLDDECADASFTHPTGSGGKPVRITWDMARAKKAGLGGKDMYSKYPRQMLKSRVISEGCRTVYPAATSGLYVPDEVVTFKQAPEKNMGTAQVVPAEDDDETRLIPGEGLHAATPPAGEASPPPPTSSPSGAASFISADQVQALRKRLTDCDKFAEESFLKIAKISKLEELPNGDFDEAIDWADRREKKFKAA